MRSSLLSAFALAPIMGALAAPHHPASGTALEDIRAIDWEAELLGPQEGGIEKRARTEQSMDAIFKKLGKLYFGTCADASLLNNAQNSDILKADFGQLTPENRYATFHLHV
jgi:endo-1,4-beta-xylanase